MKYTIKKGNHYANFTLPKLFCKDMVRFTFLLTDSCWYENSTGHNKLVGLGAFPHHHKKSIRLTWKPTTEKGWFDIYVYWYNGNGWEAKYLFTAEANRTYMVTMYPRRGIVSAGALGMCFTDVELPRITYLLRPYFGGRDTAPHNMDMWLW